MNQNLIGINEKSNSWPKGKYYIECKFSNPYDFPSKRKTRVREKLDQQTVAWFRTKCLEVKADKNERTLGVLVTNRIPDIQALKFAHTYGILILCPDRPPALAIPAIASKKQRCWPTDPKQELSVFEQTESLFALKGDRITKSPVSLEEFFKLYSKWLEKLDPFINRLLENN